MNNIIKIEVIQYESGALRFISDTPQPTLGYQLPPVIQIFVQGRDGYVTPFFDPEVFSAEGRKA